MQNMCRGGMAYAFTVIIMVTEKMLPLKISYLHIKHKIPEFPTRQFKVIISVVSVHQSVFLSTSGGPMWPLSVAHWTSPYSDPSTQGGPAPTPGPSVFGYKVIYVENLLLFMFSEGKGLGLGRSSFPVICFF